MLSYLKVYRQEGFIVDLFCLAYITNKCHKSYFTSDLGEREREGGKIEKKRYCSFGLTTSRDSS